MFVPLLLLFFSTPCFHSNFEIFVKNALPNHDKKVHQKNIVTINFANKQEKIIIIIEKKKKIRINSLSGEKKLGKSAGREKESRGKISSGKNLVTCKKFSHFSPTFFSPIRYSSQINSQRYML